MNIELKEDSIVVLIGAMGTGKSTFARQHFKTHHIIETDNIRAQLTGDFENQTQNKATFEILYATVEARAKAGILTVIDSTGSRSVLQRAQEIAKEFDRPLVALKFPHLDDSQLTKDRMQHRMHYIDVYHNQVKRIDETVIHKDYDLYELSDVNDVRILITQAQEEFKLDSEYDYVVVPDLHGEFRVIDNLMKDHEDTNTKFIFLGDIVDRGESSYNTFYKVKELLEADKARVVISNHDNKFYRWLKKWSDDSSRDKYMEQSEFDIPSYGMTVNHGLEKTLLEFFGLDAADMDMYAFDFIDYYESLPPFLILEKRDYVHYFSHAGLSPNIALGMKPNKADESFSMYKTIQGVDEVESLFYHRRDENIVVHIGHNYVYDEVTTFNKGNYMFVMHDFGIGKRYIKEDEMPTFMIV